MSDYPGPISNVLREKNIEVGDHVKITRKDGLIIEGILMPRIRGGNFLVIKLRNGYNVGISWDKIVSIELIAKRKSEKPNRSHKLSRREGYPLVKIVGTGGTIASKIDYETGAVKPAMSAEELAEDIPELLDIADIEAEQLLEVLSENLKPNHWELISKAVHAELLRDDVVGVVVTHGTDTMSYTAAALSFALGDLNKPVVLTGAQRSSDRPSSDAAFNLMASLVTSVKAPFAEVVVVMHGETGDTYAVVHRGTRVKKFHSTRRDAFQSVCDEPLAYVWPWVHELKTIGKILNRRNNNVPKLNARFDPRVLQLRAYPGMPSDLLELAVEKGFKGVIIEGTGMGHVAEDLVPTIKELTEKGIFVGITSQCVHGTVNLNVYSTGRKMLEAGAVPLGDMLTEVATVKLMWALTKSNDIEDIKKIMLNNIAGEIREKRTINLYRLSYPKI